MLRLLAQLAFFAALVFLLRLPFAEDGPAVPRTLRGTGAVRAEQVGAFDAVWAAQAAKQPGRQAVGGPVPASTDLSGWRTYRSDDPKSDGAAATPGTVRRTASQETFRVLQKKEKILRAHFENLRGEMDDVERERSAVERALANPGEQRNRSRRAVPAGRQAALERRLSELENSEREIREAREILLRMSMDRQQYEKWVRLSLPQEIAFVQRSESRRPLQLLRRQDVPRQGENGDGSTGREPARFVLDWPVIPAEGLSAGFLDASYEERFGLAHEAIDIPVEQGSSVRAAADGVVVAIADNGYGYNTIVLEHEDGLQTLYGHVSQFLVAEGERVRGGQTIALSGGRPGSKGAGFLTTGPHVHFETRLYGSAIDPLYFLSPMDAARSVANESVIPAM